jgi:hypothetical protein
MSAVNNLLDFPEGLEIQEMEERKRWLLITAKVMARDASVLLFRHSPQRLNGDEVAGIAGDLHLHRAVLAEHMVRRGYYFLKKRDGKRQAVEFLMEPSDFERIREMSAALEMTPDTFIREAAAAIAKRIRDFRREHGTPMGKRCTAHA